MKTLLVTGSSGLIGSEVVGYFHGLGWRIHGFDNNMRADFFGELGDTRWNQRRLQAAYDRFWHHEIDIRNRELVLKAFEEVRPDAIVHAAAQPSHDLAGKRPFDDFDVNVVGTVNLLEATRRSYPEAVFIYMSSNKVYGDAPNELPLKELLTRWDYSRPEDFPGIREDMRIDQSTHSVFGASKVAADVMVQEYGRYFGLQTCSLRGGCLTGPNHSGVELHGFLSYLTKVNLSGGLYRIYGYKGKQVRDNIHSLDVARFMECFIARPRAGQVYNIGGGRGNSCSILEAFGMVEAVTGRRMNFEYIDQNRVGDHICYLSNLSKCREHFPEWDVTINLEAIFDEIAASWKEKVAVRG